MTQINIKIVCINNIEIGRDSQGKPRHKRLPITIGQVYDAKLDKTISLNDIKYYTLVTDNVDKDMTYPAHFFVTLEVWREMQLNKLL